MALTELSGNISLIQHGLGQEETRQLASPLHDSDNMTFNSAIFHNSTAAKLPINLPGSDTIMTSNNSTPDSYYYAYYNEEELEAHDQRIHTKFYMLALVLPFGLFFNTFAFAVFLKSKNINKTTTGRFLIALAVADNMFLIGEFLRWLNTSDTGGDILYLHFEDEYLGWCGTIYFIRYYGQLVSGWITCAITIERFIGVSYPLKAHRISTKLTTHVTILSLYVISALVTCFPYWTLQINNTDGVSWCAYKNQRTFDIWLWVIIRILSLLLPSAFIFIFTGLIVFKLHEMSKSRKRLSNLDGPKNRRKPKQNLERQLTFMLIAVSITFLILRLPYIITYYMFEFRYNIWGNDMGFWPEHRLWLAKDICDVIATTNHCVNFFLYCLTGTQFRSTIYGCIQCRDAPQQGKKTIYTHTFKSNTGLTAIQSNESNSSLSLNGSANFKVHVKFEPELNESSRL